MVATMVNTMGFLWLLLWLLSWDYCGWYYGIAMVAIMGLLWLLLWDYYNYYYEIAMITTIIIAIIATIVINEINED